MRGNLTWQTSQRIMNALDNAFYASFKNVKPTGKRHLLGVDVSGSMSWSSGNLGIDAATLAAAMAMVTAKTESEYCIMGFSHQFRDLGVSPRHRLDDVMEKMSGRAFGATDCALPMLYASRNNILVDNFVIYTDCETWFGKIHPVQALQAYRQQTGIAAKLTVVGITATEFTIADPEDSGMLDVVGFDSATPQIIADFAR